MPDICMCLNHTCSIRSTCYRFRAVPDGFRQTYADFLEHNGVCNKYMEVQANDKLVPTEEVQYRPSL